MRTDEWLQRAARPRCWWVLVAQSTVLACQPAPLSPRRDDSANHLRYTCRAGAQSITACRESHDRRFVPLRIGSLDAAGVARVGHRLQLHRLPKAWRPLGLWLRRREHQGLWRDCTVHPRELAEFQLLLPVQGCHALALTSAERGGSPENRGESAHDGPGFIGHLPIDHLDGLDKWEDLPRDGRCVRDMWF